MTDEGPTHAGKPGTTLRLLYVASLAPLLAYLGFLVYAMLSPARFRSEYDQLGMTEPGLSFGTLEALATFGNAVMTAAPIAAVWLVISGWPVLKRGSRRTMKIFFLANCILVALVVVFGWYLPFMALRRGFLGG